MITQEDLERSEKEAEEALKPIKAAFKKVKENYEETSKEVIKPFLKLLEDYYDEQLKDKNGNSVRVGDTIWKVTTKYVVIERGMQFILGEMLMNPRVVVKRIGADGTTNPAGKETHIHPSELQHYELVKQPETL